MFASSFSMQHSSCSAYIRHTMISHLFTACIIVKKKKKALNTSRITFTHGMQQLTSYHLHVTIQIQVEHWWLEKKVKM